MIGAVGEEEIQALVRKLLQKALGGDLAAAKFVFSYTVGKPGKGVDPDDVDGGLDLWRRVDAGPSVPEALGRAVYAVPGPVSVALFEKFQPAIRVNDVVITGMNDPVMRAQMATAQRRRTIR